MPTIARGATTGAAGAPPLQTLVVNGVAYPADPSDLTLTMWDPAGLVVDGFPRGLDDLIRDGVGEYRSVWAVAVDATLGTYTASWDGLADGAPITGVELWLVVEVGSIGATPAPIVPLVEALGILGVEAGSPDATRVSTLLDAVSGEIRRLANREFTGAVQTHDETLVLGHANPFRLPWVPVSAVTSLTRVYFDGTTDAALDADDWRLEDAAAGIVRLRRGVTYLRAVWTSTGEIPAAISEACREWLRDRWTTRDQNAALASYHTGEDSEAYFPAMAGKPPRAAAFAIYGARHERGGGVV
jgi:hypothetical protein